MTHLLRSRGFLLATATLYLLSSVVNASCDLPCVAPGATCVEGAANFDEHQMSGEQQPFVFHQETAAAVGQYCDCPDLWTGVLCDVPFSRCDNSDHKCYNGGTCALFLDGSNSQVPSCDCSTAADNDQGTFSGKFCEHKDVVHCSTSDDGDDDFCANGGKCNPDYPDFGDLCLCRPGFDGPNCQNLEEGLPDKYKDAAAPSDTTYEMETCDLNCLNQGQCVFGPAATDFSSFNDRDDDDDDQDDMHCDCADGFGGTFCETKTGRQPESSTACGDLRCYNGGQCVETMSEVTGEKDFHCDCTATYTDEASYAGLQCQYKATSFCAKNEGLNGQLFCVNGGTCLENSYEGCDCPEGYSGFSCEFTTGDYEFDDDDEYEMDDDNDRLEDDDDRDNAPNRPCDLKCKMGGTCRYGKKDLGHFQNVVENVDYLDQSHNDDFQHCVCPDGYTGLLCEHKVKVCGDDEHLCLHGGQCEKDGDGSTTKTCDCSSASNSDLGADAFAGDYCEHPATDICTIGETAPTTPLSFCVNGGLCAKKVTADEPHPGCVCDSGWEGPHCELRYNKHNKRSSSSSSGRSGVEVFFTTGFFIFLIILVMLGVAAFVRRRKQRSNSMTRSLKWGSHYSDRPDPINLAPRRRSSVSSTPVFPKTSYTDSVSEPEPTVAKDVPQSTPVTPPSSSDPFASGATNGPQVYIGPPRDEDGHELHSVEIV